MKDAAKELGTEKYFTDNSLHNLKRYFQPYHLAMVQHLFAQESNDVSAMLEIIDATRIITFDWKEEEKNSLSFNKGSLVLGLPGPVWGMYEPERR